MSDATIRRLHALLARGAPKVRERPPEGSDARKLMDALLSIYWEEKRFDMGFDDLSREEFIEAAYELSERDLAILNMTGMPGEPGFHFNFKLRTPRQGQGWRRRFR